MQSSSLKGGVLEMCCHMMESSDGHGWPTSYQVMLSHDEGSPDGHGWSNVIPGDVVT